MKLSEFLANYIISPIRDEGLFVAYRVSKDTEKLLQEWAIRNIIPLQANLHSTVLYSETTPSIGIGRGPDEIVADPQGFMTMSDGSFVLLIESKELRDRHDTYIEAGGTHGFDSYLPHVTLCTGILGIIASELEPINFPIKLCEEYAESLLAD